MFKRKIKKIGTQSGLTLIELLVSIVVLMAVIAPIYGAYVHSLQRSALAHRISVAYITAQLRMEELVGRPWAGDLENSLGSVDDPPSIRFGDRVERNGFWVSVSPGSMGASDLAGDSLRHFVVSVYQLHGDAEPLVRLQHVLNVVGN